MEGLPNLLLGLDVSHVVLRAWEMEIAVGLALDPVDMSLEGLLLQGLYFLKNPRAMDDLDLFDGLKLASLLGDFSPLSRGDLVDDLLQVVELGLLSPKPVPELGVGVDLILKDGVDSVPELAVVSEDLVLHQD